MVVRGFQRLGADEDNVEDVEKDESDASVEEGVAISNPGKEEPSELDAPHSISVRGQSKSTTLTYRRTRRQTHEHHPLHRREYLGSVTQLILSE